MKVLRVLPKPCREKLLIRQLQNYRKSKYRAQTLKSRKNGRIISESLKKQAEKSRKAANKYRGPGGPTARRVMLADAESLLKRSQEVDRQTKEFASTKNERNRLRKFWGLNKK